MTVPEGWVYIGEHLALDLAEIEKVVGTKLHFGVGPAEKSQPASPRQRTARPRCPACHAHDGVPICYGYPTEETQARANAGEVVLGGCVVSGDPPLWSCTACGHQWGRLNLGPSSQTPGKGRPTPSSPSP